MAEMNAAVLHGVDDLRVEGVPRVTEPASPDDVLISMRAVGLCGSDVHYWKEGRIGGFVVEAPMILGHECAGQVVAVGENVTHLRPGDRVAIEPGVPDRTCYYCQIGRYNLCEGMRFFATPPVDGALAETVSHPAALCFPLPENVSYEEAAMLEPLSVGLHAVRRGEVGPGKGVLIMGAGPIGLICLLCAQAAGATRVYLSDVRDDRLAKARELGAAGTYRADDPSMVESLREETYGRGPDIVIDASGAPPAVRIGIQVVRPGGVLVLTGVGPASYELPALEIGLKELDVRGHFRYAHTWPTAIELVSGGKIDVRQLITHHYNLPQVVEAFEHTHSMRDGAIKVMVTVGAG